MPPCIYSLDDPPKFPWSVVERLVARERNPKKKKRKEKSKRSWIHNGARIFSSTLAGWYLQDGWVGNPTLDEVYKIGCPPPFRDQAFLFFILHLHSQGHRHYLDRQGRPIPFLPFFYYSFFFDKLRFKTLLPVAFNSSYSLSFKPFLIDRPSGHTRSFSTYPYISTFKSILVSGKILHWLPFCSA